MSSIKEFVKLQKILRLTRKKKIRKIKSTKISLEKVKLIMKSLTI
jgi:hypothetical protein